MLFDSFQFLLFLPAVVILYYLLPHAWRWAFLLIASYYFYAGWKVEFLALIFGVTLNAYLAGIILSAKKSISKNRLILFTSISFNLLLLFFFKYFSFFIGERNFFKNFAGQHPKVEWVIQFLEYGIPVGISFFSFQAIGYIIDVYYRKVEPEKNFFKFAFFISYFPQLVAGPIERFSNLHHQLFKKQNFHYENLANGFRLILMGLFIKMVVADNLAPLVDQVFKNPLDYSQVDNALALVFFSIQIYADFHGYSLIAIGVALMMGIHLMDNFKTPYLASSIKSFWSRWHISLSTWFKDYLYIPLGGNKGSSFRWMTNILIIFIVSGIWHGANFTFIIWGALHGLFYLIEQLAVKFKSINFKSLWLKPFAYLKTIIVINLAWLFFRSDTVAAAYVSFMKIIGQTPKSETYYSILSTEKGKTNELIDQSFLQPTIELKTLSVDSFIPFAILLLLVFELFIRQSRFDIFMSKYPMTVRWSIYALLIYCVMALSGPTFYQFIYFQF